MWWRNHWRTACSARLSAAHGTWSCATATRPMTPTGWTGRPGGASTPPSGGRAGLASSARRRPAAWASAGCAMVSEPVTDYIRFEYDVTASAQHRGRGGRPVASPARGVRAARASRGLLGLRRPGRPVEPLRGRQLLGGRGAIRRPPSSPSSARRRSTRPGNAESRTRTTGQLDDPHPSRYRAATPILVQRLAGQASARRAPRRDPQGRQPYRPGAGCAVRLARVQGVPDRARADSAVRRRHPALVPAVRDAGRDRRPAGLPALRRGHVRRVAAHRAHRAEARPGGRPAAVGAHEDLPRLLGVADPRRGPDSGLHEGDPARHRHPARPARRYRRGRGRPG